MGVLSMFYRWGNSNKALLHRTVIERDVKWSTFVNDVKRKASQADQVDSRQWQHSALLIPEEKNASPQMKAEWKTYQTELQTELDKHLEFHNTELQKRKNKNMRSAVVLENYIDAVKSGGLRYNNISQKLLDRQREAQIKKAVINFAKQLLVVAKGPDKRIRLARLLSANSHWMAMQNKKGMGKTFQHFNYYLTEAVNHLSLRHAKRIHHCLQSLKTQPVKILETAPNHESLYSDREARPMYFGLECHQDSEGSYESDGYLNNPLFVKKVDAKETENKKFTEHLATVFQKRTYSIFSCNPSSQDYTGTDDLDNPLEDDVNTLVDELKRVRSFQQALALLTPYAEKYVVDDVVNKDFFNKFTQRLANIPKSSRFYRSQWDIYRALKKIMSKNIYHDESAWVMFESIFDQLGNNLGVIDSAQKKYKKVLRHKFAEKDGIIEDYQRRNTWVSNLVNANNFLREKGFLLSDGFANYKFFLSESESTLSDTYKSIIEPTVSSMSLEELIIFYEPYLTVWNRNECEGRERGQLFEPDNNGLFMQLHGVVKESFYPKLASELLACLELNIVDDFSPQQITEFFNIMGEAYWFALENRLFQQQGDFMARLRGAIASQVECWDEARLKAFCKGVTHPTVLHNLGNLDWLARMSQRKSFPLNTQYDRNDLQSYNNAVMGVHGNVVQAAIETCNQRFNTELDIPQVRYRSSDSPPISPEKRFMVEMAQKSSSGRRRSASKSSLKSFESLIEGGSPFLKRRAGLFENGRERAASDPPPISPEKKAMEAENVRSTLSKDDSVVKTLFPSL